MTTDSLTIDTSNGPLVIGERVTLRGHKVDSISIDVAGEHLDPADRAAGYTHTVMYTCTSAGIFGSSLLTTDQAERARALIPASGVVS